MSTRQPVSLHSRPVMGRSAVDINSQVLITLTTSVTDEVRDWLPCGQLYHDFLALMHVYLGARVNAGAATTYSSLGASACSTYQ